MPLMHGRVLITGGAGFIGSHLADELLEHGYHVRVLDRLSAQVHSDGGQRPRYLNPHVETLWGDLRDAAVVERALRDIDAVYHFAAAVGVGQSMYAIEDYTSNNDLGTAVLLQALTKRPVDRLIVASSMSIYGEGLYRSASAIVSTGVERSLAQLRAGLWDPADDHGMPLQPIPTPESKPPALSSVYALSKYVQERMCLIIGRAYNIPTVALRFFNVYGPRQSLSNPYTGVLAIFASRYLNGRPPVIFEDGRQQRDFVSVHDVARACRLCLNSPAAAHEVMNIGSGAACTVLELAELMARALGCDDVPPQITGKYRMGDVRHCFADIGRARSLIGYQPQVSLEQGIVELAGWLDGQQAEDHFDRAAQELSARGLTV
jgi:dTDP-L-rhamnose 4-epimerase